MLLVAKFALGLVGAAIGAVVVAVGMRACRGKGEKKSVWTEY